MNWKEYKLKLQKKQEELEFEEKARVKVNGLWSFLSFVLSYKLKEILWILFAVSVGGSITFIINPKLAIFIHDCIFKKIQ